MCLTVHVRNSLLRQIHALASFRVPSFKGRNGEVVRMVWPPRFRSTHWLFTARSVAGSMCNVRLALHLTSEETLVQTSQLNATIAPSHRLTA